MGDGLGNTTGAGQVEGEGREVATYLAKHSTKSTDEGGVLDHRITEEAKSHLGLSEHLDPQTPGASDGGIGAPHNGAVHDRTGGTRRSRRSTSGLTPSERSMRARVAAYRMHATHDPRQTTSKARATFLSSFERGVDPTGCLSAEERQRRADAARRAHFTALALKSAQARRKRSGRGHCG
ncbi:MAG TPA: hypothetical protein VMW80_01140 [Candidatus Dormibacteraeota bacterium]|nr:hypothetical protein [Candidatus Dormibacteraeota bacterium]